MDEEKNEIGLEEISDILDKNYRELRLIGTSIDAQARHVSTIKKCVVFFTTLSIIGLSIGLVALIMLLLK